MRIRLDRVSVSSVLLTICLLSLVPTNLRSASTWQTRSIWITEELARYNYEASIAFASLALTIIGITVIWTGYQRRLRWAWFIMVVFACVYYFPVYLRDCFLEVSRVGWPWWAALVREAMEGRPFAQAMAQSLVTLTVMLIALLLPIRSFFGKNGTGGPPVRRSG